MTGRPSARVVSLSAVAALVAGGATGGDLEVMSRLGGEVRLVHAETGEAFGAGGGPLLRYDDPDRGIRTGLLRSWGRGGRPAAVAEVYQKFDEPGRWHVALSSLGGGPLRGEIAGFDSWTPPSDPLQFEAVRDAPAPHASPEGRLRQMKAIAQAFSGYEVFDPDMRRSELRLLPKPLIRYEDSASGVIDGGLFVLSIGTNPEILLLIEVRRDAGAEAWRFAAVRRGYAEMHLLYEDREVWRCDRVWETRPDDPMYEVVTEDPAGPVPTRSSLP